MRPFTRSTEYAIRYLTYLAQQRQGESFHLARKMSEVLGIPAPFLGKILQPLVMRGLLQSQRGRNGGFRLALKPEEVTLLQIAESQERVFEKRLCFLGQSTCEDDAPCPMHDYWKEVAAKFERRMSETTLENLVHFADKHPNSEYPLPENL